MTNSWVWRDSFMRVAWPIHVCCTTHSCVWHDYFVCVTRLVHVCGIISACVWHYSFMRVTWLVHVSGIVRSCATWYIHTRDTTHLVVTWLLHICDPFVSPNCWTYVWHDSFRMCDMTHFYMSDMIDSGHLRLLRCRSPLLHLLRHLSALLRMQRCVCVCERKRG